MQLQAKDKGEGETCARPEVMGERDEPVVDYQIE